MKTNYSLITGGLLLLAVITIQFSSCRKKDEKKPESDSSAATTTTSNFYFSNLTADTTVIPLGGKAVITAAATGDNLTYNWSVNTNSTIIGSGYQVQLHISCPTCASQPNVVTCKVKDANNNSETKTITITVK